MGRPLGAALVTAVAVGAGVVLGQEGDGRTALLLGLVLAAAAALGAFRLAWHLRRAEDAALSDPLTGLPNRILLADRVEQALRRSQRTGEPFALVVCDLDGFKGVNDQHGHAAGDALLRELAGRFRACVRATDTVARLGGDEFVVLSLGARDEHEVAALVARLRQALREPVDAAGVRVRVDASIGWALHPADGGTTEELLLRADEQMLATKRHAGAGGRRRSSSSAVLRALESALHQGRLVVHYQPVIELGGGQAVRAHAVVRGCATARGVLTPVALPGSVEETPLAPVLALATAADVLERAREWREHGHRLGVGLRVPLRALQDGRLVEGLARLLDRTGTPEDDLTVELALGGAGEDGPDPAVLAAIARLGVRVGLADALRSSGVAALGEIPLDELEIDASLVRGLPRSPADATVVRALVEAGRELGFAISAEGVESAEALAELRRIGCDYARGPHLSPALPPDELLAWVSARLAAAAAV